MVVHAVKPDGNSICGDKNKKRIFFALASIGAKVVQGQAAGKEFCDSRFLPPVLIDRKKLVLDGVPRAVCG